MTNESQESKSLSQFDFNRSEDRWKAAIALAIYTAIMGGGTSVISTKWRVDPYTGSQGAIVEADVANLKKRLDQLERDMGKLPPDWLKQSVAEHTYLIQNIQSMLAETMRQQDEHEREALKWKERIQNNSQAVLYLQHLVGVKQ